MKSILSSLVIVFICSTINAQNVTKSEKYKISFTTTEVLKQYETESETVLGYENNNYAVDIETFPIAEQSAKFIESQKYGARKSARGLGLEDIEEGAFLPYIERAYYVIAYDKYEGKSIPVYVIAFINKEIGIAYEATVYCYSLDLEEGKKIANSFRLID